MKSHKTRDPACAAGLPPVLPRGAGTLRNGPKSTLRPALRDSPDAPPGQVPAGARVCLPRTQPPADWLLPCEVWWPQAFYIYRLFQLSGNLPEFSHPQSVARAELCSIIELKFSIIIFNNAFLELSKHLEFLEIFSFNSLFQNRGNRHFFHLLSLRLYS